MRFLILALLVFIISCAPNKIIKEHRYPNNTILEKLDVEAFFSAKDETTKDYAIKVSRNGYNNTVNRIEKTFLKTNKVVLISGGLINSRIGAYRVNFQKDIYDPEKPFTERSVFYPNGGIFIQGNYFTGLEYINKDGFTIRPYDYEEGIWKYYDRQGKIIKTIDYDSYFDFSLNDVIDYIKENNFEEKIINRPIDRFVNEESNRGYWNIRISNNEGRFKLVLDGKTGEVISKQKYQIQF